MPEQPTGKVVWCELDVGRSDSAVLPGACTQPVRDLVAHEHRTEGWAAGLQLAALSARGRTDAGDSGGVAGFVDAFTGSHRFVLDYLVEEVLNSQPDDIRRFLLDTSVLQQMTGTLCDALTGRDDGRQTLEILERGNLFVVPLNDQRQMVSLVADDGEPRNSHRSACVPPAARRHARQISCHYATAGHSLGTPRRRQLPDLSPGRYLVNPDFMTVFADQMG